jgi:hypothetical protein
MVLFNALNASLWITLLDEATGKSSQFVDKPVDNPVDTFVDSFLPVLRFAVTEPHRSRHRRAFDKSFGIELIVGAPRCYAKSPTLRPDHDWPAVRTAGQSPIQDAKAQSLIELAAQPWRRSSSIPAGLNDKESDASVMAMDL